MVKVKALVNIKYDNDCFKIGDKFEIRKEDFREMIEKGIVEEVKEESK
ncbi:hypothetical protein [Clostridium tetani]|nr:hypothetical protein [Clostridium tetani]CDI50301.1 hypothetical protein BN906_02317 [Clostridium tetani 12124569]